MKTANILGIIFFLTGSFIRYSFAREIKGTVVDKNNEPLAFVSVIVKNTAYDTMTDFDGNFMLAIDDSIVVLVFSYIGYTEKEIVVAKDTNRLIVTLVADAVELNSVLIISPRYEKRLSESSCVTISSYDLVSFPGTSRKSSSKKMAAKYAPSASESESYSGARILTAGEVHDFSKWTLWEDITNEQLHAYTAAWSIYPIERYTLQLTTEKGMPIVDAEVELINENKGALWKARTDNTGKAELWLNAFTADSVTKQDVSFSFSVQYNGNKYALEDIREFHDGINVLKIPVECAMPDMIDIAFVVDATGSMQDEINYLKSELNDIVEKISDSLPETHLNLGCVFYRDVHDAYVTKTSDFSPKIAVTSQFINSNNADGGGDTPEAVEEALDVAVNQLSWNPNARARILFLVLDAPPHNDIQTIEKMQTTLKQAAERGIRIIPIACSGIDKSGEYLMRTFSLLTNGSYVFLTDHSGVGYAHIEPTTDKYDVNLLNALLQRLILQFTKVPSCRETTLTEKTDTSFIVIPDTSAQTTDSLSKLKSEEPLSRKRNKDENTENEIKWKYYPNPTFGIVTVEVPSDFKTLFVTDFSGKIVQRYPATDQSTFQIDLGNFSTGTYYLKCEYAPDKWATGKVVLVH